MRPPAPPALLFCALLALAVLPATLSPASEPVKVVFDTDMGNDVDDAMALAMVLQLERRGVLELLAVTSTKDHPKSAAYIDALHLWYGREGVPVGAVREGETRSEGRFLGQIDRTGPEGEPLFPRNLESGLEAPEAVALLRETLAAQPDGSVVLVQVGFFTNFARLLDSEPDAVSDLGGRDLVERKVRELVVMGGTFQTVRHETRYPEYNVRIDIPAARKVAEEWPTPVVWSGYEIGIAAAYPWESIIEDYNYVEHHLVRDSYLAYVPEHPHDRPVWDLTAVLYAAWPERGYFDLSPPGKVSVDEEGHTDFRKDEEGLHRYLLMDVTQAARVREACVLLCSEPPAKLRPE